MRNCCYLLSKKFNRVSNLSFFEATLSLLNSDPFSGNKKAQEDDRSPKKDCMLGNKWKILIFATGIKLILLFMNIFINIFSWKNTHFRYCLVCWCRILLELLRKKKWSSEINIAPVIKQSSREGLNEKKNVFFRATWSSFFGSRNSRFESQFRTENTIYTI